jgi:hypothetical protein
VDGALLELLLLDVDGALLELLLPDVMWLLRHREQVK